MTEKPPKLETVALRWRLRRDEALKIAVSGKGGVGKTTLAALLSFLYADEGKRVLAVDADPDSNLASALGVPEDVRKTIVPLARRDELIRERTGAEPGMMGQFFTLNPRVDDIPQQYSIEVNGIKLLVMGGITRGGGGCACPENALLSRLIRHLVLENEDTVIMDMEAGLEHLGRGTAKGVDAFVVVVEPGQRSLQTAREVSRLAKDIGVENVLCVGNKVRPGQEDVIRKGTEGMDLLGYLPYDPLISEGDMRGLPVTHCGEGTLAAARHIKSSLDDRLRGLHSPGSIHLLTEDRSSDKVTH